MSDNFYRNEYQRQHPRRVTVLIRAAQAESSPDFFAKLIALLLLLLCVGLGMVGLILPIIPGLLFLALAALLASSMFPAFGLFVQRTPWLSKLLTPYLDNSRGFSRLSGQGKLRFLLWFSARVLVDSFVLLWRMLARVVDFASTDKPRRF